MTPQSPHRWAEADRIFHNALAYPPDQRTGYIRNACGDDAQLFEEVQSLLAYHERADAMAPTLDLPLQPASDLPLDIEPPLEPDPAPEPASAEEPASPPDARPVVAATPRRGAFTPLWWWQLHQLLVSVAYGMAVYVVWLVWQSSGQSLDHWAYIAALGAALLSSTLRMHLWFSSRWYLDEWAALRYEIWPWLRLADSTFGILLIASGAAHRLDQPRLSPVLVGTAVIVLFLFILVEPAAVRATMKSADSELG